MIATACVSAGSANTHDQHCEQGNQRAAAKYPECVHCAPPRINTDGGYRAAAQTTRRAKKVRVLMAKPPPKSLLVSGIDHLSPPHETSKRASAPDLAPKSASHSR